MNKKGGFTLIELLAVIVILAIIAVIAVPIVLNIIDESKNNAGLRSAEMYVKAAEMSVAQATLKNKNITDNTYSIMSDGNICLETLTSGKCIGKDNRENHEDDILKVEVNGEKPSSGAITISKGNITGVEIVLNDKTIVKNSEGKLVFVDVKKACTYVDSEDDTGDAIGKIDLSDIVTCGTESFYVITNDGSNIEMITKYGLNVGEFTYPGEQIGIQSEKLALEECAIEVEEGSGCFSDVSPMDVYYGSVFFTETLYWYEVDEYGNPAYDDSGYPIYLPKYEDGYIYNENSLVYPYVESYVSYLKTTFDLTTISGTLANSEQVSKLINLNITSPSYYTGCIYDMDAVIIVGNEDMHPANYALAQVRPVIIIPANEIEK